MRKGKWNNRSVILKKSNTFLFVYEDMTLSAKGFKAGETVTAKVTIRNNSDRAGKETVMLYMRDVVASNAVLFSR